MERGRKGEGEREREKKKGESLKTRRGQAAPFIVGWAILLLPGNYEEVGGIPGYSQVTVGVEFVQNARRLGHCLCDL